MNGTLKPNEKMREVLLSIFDGRSLKRNEAAQVMGLMMAGEVPPEQIAAFIGAIRTKGETLEELIGFASAMRERAVRVPVTRSDVIDTCGTGGDNSGTFNISTASALVVAGAGVAAAKHGNRSVSSRSGSADVLEALGVPIELPPEEAAAAIETNGFAFLFAPKMHPAFKNVEVVRRMLGVRTMFNLLGPLLNPARVKRQVVGVYDPKLMKLMISVLREFDSEEAMIVSSRDGLDELSLSAPTRVLHLKGGRIREYEVKSTDFGLKALRRTARDVLKGGSAAQNAALIEEILHGRDPGPRRDIVLLNAAAALVVSGAAKNFKEGLALAGESIDRGGAARVLEKARAPR